MKKKMKKMKRYKLLANIRLELNKLGYILNMRSQTQSNNYPLIDRYNILVDRYNSLKYWFNSRYEYRNF